MLTMKDWIKELDRFLTITHKEMLIYLIYVKQAFDKYKKTIKNYFINIRGEI